MTTSIAPHTRIDNSVILNMAQIGVYGYAVYSAIKMHLHQATGACFPSYATIARITGMNRLTVIEYVKKLTALRLIDPRHRFKDDGSFTSNQYDFQGTKKTVPAKNQGAPTQAPAKGLAQSVKMQGTENPVSSAGSRPEPPQVVAPDNPPGRPEPPEQSDENKKKGTITKVDSMASEKQQTCPHPPELVVMLPDTIIICNHCYGLLDENRKLRAETPPEMSKAA